MYPVCSVICAHACTHTHVHTQRPIPLDCNGRTCVECAKDLLPLSECANMNRSVVLIEEVDDTTDNSINGIISVSRSRLAIDKERPVLNN